MSFLKVFFFEVQLNFNVVLVSGLQQSDSVININVYPFFSDSFSHVGYYGVLSRVPCAIQ